MHSISHADILRHRQDVTFGINDLISLIRLLFVLCQKWFELELELNSNLNLKTGPKEIIHVFVLLELGVMKPSIWILIKLNLNLHLKVGTKGIIYVGHVWLSHLFKVRLNLNLDEKAGNKGITQGIWVRSRNCGCLVTWFCYQLIAKPGNKTATVSWPDPYIIGHLCGESTC